MEKRKKKPLKYQTMDEKRAGHVMLAINVAKSIAKLSIYGRSECAEMTFKIRVIATLNYGL